MRLDANAEKTKQIVGPKYKGRETNELKNVIVKGTYQSTALAEKKKETEMKYCKHCGFEISDHASYCGKCGKTVHSGQPDNLGENTELIALSVVEGAVQGEGKKIEKKGHKGVAFIAAGALVIIIVLLVGGVGIYNSTENRSKRLLQKFISYVDEKKYAQAEEMMQLPDNIEGEFSEFASQNLKECIVKEAGQGYQLVSGGETYNVSCNPDAGKISSADFFMKYQVKYSSYLSSGYNSFGGFKSEKLEDGTTLYTVTAYKVKRIECKCNVLLGDSESLSGVVTIKAETDGKHKICNILEAKRSDEEYDGAEVEDGMIVIDKYYISEQFSGELARQAARFYNSFTNSAIWSEDSFDDLYNLYHEIIFDTEEFRKNYESLSADKGRYTAVTALEGVSWKAEEWSYPQSFCYSEGSYKLKVKMTVQALGEGMEDSTNSGTIYFLFKPGKERFKLYSDASEENDLEG